MIFSDEEGIYGGETAREIGSSFLFFFIIICNKGENMFCFDITYEGGSVTKQQRNEQRRIDGGDRLINKVIDLTKQVERAKAARLPEDYPRFYAVLSKKLNDAEQRLANFSDKNWGIWGTKIWYGPEKKFKEMERANILSKTMSYGSPLSPAFNIISGIHIRLGFAKEDLVGAVKKFFGKAWNWLKKDLTGGMPLTLENIRDL